MTYVVLCSHFQYFPSFRCAGVLAVASSGMASKIIRKPASRKL